AFSRDGVGAHSSRPAYASLCVSLTSLSRGPLRMRQDRQNLVKQLEELLPQTQCTKCGFDGCTPYAEAMANGEAEINRCPPGGEAGIKALAEALDVPLLPLDSTRGQYGPLQVAQIDEPHCIGCTLCIQAC